MKNSFLRQISFPICILLSLSFSPDLRALESHNSSKEIGSKLTKDYLNKRLSEDYIIGSGDILNIILSRESKEINGTYTVDGSGTIYLPRIHRIYVSGLTINELNKLLDERFSEFLLEPKAEVIVLAYRPIQVYIEGEVEQPGMYTLAVDGAGNLPTKKSAIIFPTLYDAIQRSGGVTIFSDLENVEIIRINPISNGGGKKKATINFLSALGSGGSRKKNIRIYDGDVINVKRTNIPITNQLSKAMKSNLNPKYIDVYVAGRVEKSGRLKVPKTSSLEEALDMAGGTKFLKGRVRFVRAKSDGSIDRRVFAYRRNLKRGSYANPYLKSGDLIFVGKSAFNIANEILREVASPFFGIYAIKELTEDFIE
tara:strand:- start:1409 stop:2512 length:1104 start_codon:yes stop_codon:yes gene_type:complete